MNRTRLATVCFFAIAMLPLPAKDKSLYASLWLYNGTWQATKSDAPAGVKPDVIKDDCALVGTYFACQQTVNGKVGSLLIFVPAAQPGHFYTQAVVPQGFATGRGELQIENEHWTYSSKAEENGKTTYYRATNVFSGKDRIHFEQLESPDGTHWTVTGSGDEVRTRKKE